MNKIEEYLNSIGNRQRYLIYIMIFGVIVYIFIQLLMPKLYERREVKSEIENLQSKIEKNQINRLKNNIKILDRQILKLREKYEKKKEEIDYLISGLYKLKFAFYDEKEWANSIDNILKDSLKRDIKIEYIKSRDVVDEKSKDLLKKKKTLEISGSGDYINIVAFISYIDNLNLLLNFTKSEIKLKDKELHFKLFLDMYGVGL